jgi:hypothetical protein
MNKFTHKFIRNFKIRKSYLISLIIIILILFSFFLIRGYDNTLVLSTNNADIEQLYQKSFQKTYGNIPIRFEKNQGQYDDNVRFISQGLGYTLFLTSDEAVLSFLELGNITNKYDLDIDLDSTTTSKSSTMRIKLVGSNISPTLEGLGKLPGKSNYFIGNDADNWQTDIPNYSRVCYNEVYPGIDLIYYGNQRKLEYDFIIAPHFDPNQISLRFEGNDSTVIDKDGNLLLKKDGKEVVFKAPEIYQEVDGEKIEVNGSYCYLQDKVIGFDIGAYNDEIPLIIDPKLIYATYLGGSLIDYGWDIAVDTLGHAYVVGETHSPDFPTKNGIENMPVGGNKISSNIFLAKLSPDGKDLIYSTYIGGSRDDKGYAIAVDLEGNAYITGPTASHDFPMEKARDSTFEPDGLGDGFVTKINPKGNGLVFSTYLGGSYHDFPHGIAVDCSKNVFIGGFTASIDFPTENAYLEFPGDYRYDNDTTSYDNIFVSKLDSTGSQLIFSTYIGGQSTDRCYDIAIDSSGNVYLTGETTSTDFPMVNPYQSSFLSSHSGWSMAIVCKLDSTGSNLSYSTYLGGDGQDIGFDIALLDNRWACVVGHTYGNNFPSVNPFLTLPAGTTIDAGFITIFNPEGNDIFLSSLVAGTDHSTTCYGVAVDPDNIVYISGQNNTTDLPIHDPIKPGVQYPGGFVYVLNPFEGEVIYSTSLLTGYGYQGHEITLDQWGDIYLTGVVSEWAKDFPVQNAYQQTLGGKDDAYIAKIGYLEDAILITEIDPEIFIDLLDSTQIETVLKPGEKWTFSTNFVYNLVSADSGVVRMVIETSSGDSLGESLMLVKRGVNVKKTKFQSPEVTIPELKLDEVDTLNVKLELIPANAPNATASDYDWYRMFIHKWTFMVYLAADNDLEDVSIIDFLEMTEIPSNDSIAVVMLYDRHPGYDNEWFILDGDDIFFSEEYGWADTRRFLRHEKYEIVERVGEKNMGDPATLRNFVQWSMKEYPAQHYALVLWNHGGGWKASTSSKSHSGLRKKTQNPGFPKLPPGRRGINGNYKDVGVDETDNDILLSSEIKMALSGLPKLDILAFDACLMSMIENAYQFRQVADYMVASQALEDWDGWPYHTILDRLHDRPHMSAVELAHIIVDEYGISYPRDVWDVTQSATNLWEIEGVAKALDDLAAIFIEKRPWAEIEMARNQSKYFWPMDEHRDLYHFAQLLKNISNDQSIKTACDNLINALDRAIIANYHSTLEENANGLAIFFPKVISQYDASYDWVNNIQLSNDTQWDEFLRLFISRGDSIVDTYEPNNTLTQAYGPILPGTEYFSYFSNADDKDFYFFTTGMQTSLTALLTSSTTSWDIAFYDFNGNLLGKSNSTTSNDTLSFTALPPSSYFIEVISNQNALPEVPYKLEVNYQGSQSGRMRLSSDDGVPDSSLYSTNSGDLVGMRFHAPTYPMNLDEVSLYIESIDGAGTGGNGSFYVWIADYYGTMFEPIKVTPVSGSLQKRTQVPGWFTMDLSDSAITVQSDFFVGIGYDGTNTPTLGIDSLDNGRSFQWSSAGQSWRSLDASAFIRSKVSYLQTLERVRIFLPSELAVESGDTVSIPVEISNVPTTGIDSLEIEFYFNPSTLRFTSLSHENTLTSDWNLEKLDFQPAGRINIQMSAGNKISSAGNLFKIQFQVQETATNDTVELSFNNALLNGGEYFVETKGSMITIKTTTNVVESSNLPVEFSLWQNYPNPFNPVTTIPFSLPKAEKVKIEVFDLLGRNIGTILNQEMSIGLHEIRFEAHDLPTGIYVYKIVAGDYIAKKKCLLMK